MLFSLCALVLAQPEEESERSIEFSGVSVVPVVTLPRGAVVPVELDRVHQCDACMDAGQDYCITRNRCTERATHTCADMMDHVTGDADFGAEGHLMDCEAVPERVAEWEHYRHHGRHHHDHDHFDHHGHFHDHHPHGPMPHAGGYSASLERVKRVVPGVPGPVVDALVPAVALLSVFFLGRWSVRTRVAAELPAQAGSEA